MANFLFYVANYNGGADEMRNMGDGDWFRVLWYGGADEMRNMMFVGWFRVLRYFY